MWFRNISYYFVRNSRRESSHDLIDHLYTDLNTRRRQHASWIDKDIDFTNRNTFPWDHGVLCIADAEGPEALSVSRESAECPQSSVDNVCVVSNVLLTEWTFPSTPLAFLSAVLSLPSITPRFYQHFFKFSAHCTYALLFFAEQITSI